MKSLQKQVEFGQKKAMKKVGNKKENLIHCLNLISDCRVVSSDELFSTFYDLNELNGYLLCLYGISF